MPLSHTIEPAAQAELAEASAFYEARESGSGVRLILAVDAAIIKIGELPNAWPKIRGGMRRCPVEGYPYWLLYSHTAEMATIMVVCHSSRRPEYWRGRVKRR